LRFAERPSLTRARRHAPASPSAFRFLPIREIRVFAADFCFVFSVF
jgi:hypothetical protein